MLGSEDHFRLWISLKKCIPFWFFQENLIHFDQRGNQILTLNMILIVDCRTPYQKLFDFSLPILWQFPNLKLQLQPSSFKVILHERIFNLPFDILDKCSLIFQEQCKSLAKVWKCSFSYQWFSKCHLTKFLRYLLS